MDLTLRLDRTADVRPSPRDQARRLDPVVVAALAVAVSAAGASRPSLWFDEAATISASGRSLAQLWRLLDHIDAVHGLYYLIMHGWFAVFPVTEFWSRLPSCLAVGAAAAGVVVLARQFCGRSVAVSVGVVFAILPRITWAGVEARSYAFAAVAAVWLTVLLVAAVRRNRPSLWLLYGLALTATILLNLFVALMVLVHAVVLWVMPGRRSAITGWAVASAVAVAAMTPFVLFSRTQMAQIDWIAALKWHNIVDIAQKQYFDGSVPFASLAGLIIAAAVLARRSANSPAESGARQLVVIAIAWMVIPTAVLLAYSVLLKPMYYPRFLCFTAPAAALLLGICIVAVARTPLRIAAVIALFAVAAVPNYLFVQRGPYAKDGMDFSQVADVISKHAAAGDCLILDNTSSWAPGPIRPLTAARPSAYAKLVDPGRGRRATERNTLWDAHLAISGVADRVRQCTVLWTVSDRDKTLPAHESGLSLPPGARLARAPAYQVPQRLGFHIVERWQFNLAQVTKSTR